MKTHTRFISMLTLTFSLSLLLTVQTAHADFRKALEAYQARDGATMLKEVKDAVEKKNDDGLILYLSILKQYPKTWQSTLDSSQQVELFNCLEKATMQSSLQAQYRLALISRLNDYPKPDSSEAAQEELALIQRLEPVANKGYAPAAYHLYGHRSPKSKDDQANAIKWLIKAAELGSTEAAFKLGMKYLNVVDDYYGCVSYEPNLCLPKDEAKGWYWMQQAAVQANERNIILGDFAYEMGNLYYQGVAGNKPDLEQAYLWYLLGANNAWYFKPSIRIKEQLERMQKMGQLKRIAPQLDKSWNDVENREQQLHPKQLLKLPNLLKSKQSKYGKTKSFFSFFSLGWDGWGQVIDIYSDGIVMLSNNEMPINHDVYEKVIKIKPEAMQSLISELKLLGINEWPLRSDFDVCFRDCFGLKRYYMTINTREFKKTVMIGSELYSVDSKSKGQISSETKNLANILMILHKYFPENYPVDQLRCNLSTQKSQCENVINVISSLAK